MDTIRVLYTKRENNLFSWLIRWLLPRSRFSLAEASHCVILDGDYAIEAHMIHGVRRDTVEEVMKGLTVVRDVSYSVLDAEAGLRFGRLQDGKRYDWKGAMGVALSPDRNWQDPSTWYCFELAAAILAKAGRDVFVDTGHITGNMLLGIKP